MSTTFAPANPIKIWPLVAIAGFKFGGAVRTWFLVRSLDTSGAGWVSISDFKIFLAALGVNQRTANRWISDSIKMRLLKPHAKRFYYVKLARGCEFIGCDKIGSRPVFINVNKFVSKGWKTIVWAGYHATLDSRPVSQRVKKSITGVPARSQVRYEQAQPITKIHNICDRGKWDENIAVGLRDTFGYTIFQHRGRMKQKLPNGIIVPSVIAIPLKRGRTRKAHKMLNSLQVGRGKQYSGELFFDKRKNVEQNMKKFYQDDIPPWEIPDCFYHQKTEAIGNTILVHWKLQADKSGVY